MIDPSNQVVSDVAHTVAELPQWIAPVPFIEPIMTEVGALMTEVGALSKLKLPSNMLSRLDNRIPASIDKIIKPKIKLQYSGNYSGDFLRGKNIIGEGAENVVYSNGNNVFKIRNFDNPTSDIKGIKEASNTIMNLGGPNTRIFRYFKHPTSGKLQPIIKQDFVSGTKGTQADLNILIDKFGLKKYSNNSFNFNGKYVGDLHPENIIVENGVPKPIDLYFSKKTPL